MSDTPKKTPVEETLLFMSILTFVGGYLNAYSYFNRGGAFVTFHTGNLARIGISAYTGDKTMFIACIVPILGGFLGAMLAQFLKVGCAKRVSTLRWQKTALVAELVALLVVPFLSAVPDNVVNFFLSLVAMFQLSNFRKYEGAIHNSTIETGNLRTLGQHVADALVKHDKASAMVALRYTAMVLTFPLGLFIGGVLSVPLGNWSILLCCVLLAVLAFVFLPKGEPAQR